VPLSPCVCIVLLYSESSVTIPVYFNQKVNQLAIFGGGGINILISVRCSESNASFIFMETTADTKSAITLFDRESSHLQNTIFNTVTIISYAFSPMMNRSLHAILVTICASWVDPLPLSPLLKCITHCLTMLTFTVWSPEMFSKHQWMPMGAILSTRRNSMTHISLPTFPFQTPFIRLLLCYHLSYDHRM